MKLTNWKNNLIPRFPNIIEKFLGKKNSNQRLNEEEIVSVPSVNISDAHKAFSVNVAIPGIDKKDIKIEVQDNCLIISSENRDEHEEKGSNWIRKEYSYASFKRIFELPENADSNKIKASMKNGILSIQVEKKEAYQSTIKTIKVE